MIKNYFKTTFRNLWKTKGYSFLNVFGLAIGITCASLIFLWVEDEMSYDNHFPNKEDIYLSKSKQPHDGGTYVFDANPGPLAPAIKAELPGIKYAARVNWPMPLLFNLGEKSLYQTGFYADPDFLAIFSLEFVEGNRSSAMDDLNDIVLTQKAAGRLFGNEPALGKQVRIDNQESYTIAGVVADLPRECN